MKVSKVILSFVLSITLFTQVLSAQMASTESITENALSSKEKLIQIVAREDVVQKFQELGVDPKMIQARVASMTDEEVSKVSHQIDTLPAGADAGASILGVAVFIFIVLLITDILGLTHVFSFTKPIKR